MAFRATFLAVVGVTLAGQLVALGFEIAAAARFGTGRDADALAFALTLFVTVNAEVLSWISTLFLPLYVAARAASAERASSLLRRAIATVFILTGSGGLLLVVAAPALIAGLAPALGGHGVEVFRAFALLLTIFPLAGLFAATLQAHGRFVAASLRQLAWYGGGLAGILALAATRGAASAPMGMYLGSLLFAALLAFLVYRAGALDRMTAGARDDDLGRSLGRLGVLMAPLLLLSSAAVLNAGIERTLAARLPEGNLAALTYGYRMLHFPVALFVTNATAMLLPSLADHAARGERGAVEALTGRALRVTVVFAVPLAALALALAEPLTRVLLERGAFTAASTSLTATAIAWYAPTVVAMALAQILFRTYQALHALWALAASVGAGIAVNVVLMTALTPLLGFHGLPLAASLSGFALVGLMLLGLRGRAGALRHALLGWSTAAVVGAGLVAGAAAWAARGFGGDSATGALVAGLVAGVVVYAGALAALAPAEARVALAMLVPAGRVA